MLGNSQIGYVESRKTTIYLQLFIEQTKQAGDKFKSASDRKIELQCWPVNANLLHVAISSLINFSVETQEPYFIGPNSRCQ